MRYRFAFLILLAACGGGDAGDTAAEDSTTIADTTTSQKAPPPLDSLIAALDSAGGMFTSMSASRRLGLWGDSINYDAFRAHGHEAVNRLIDCLPDQTQTTTTHYEAEGATYPRGILCLEILEVLTNIDSSRELAFNQEDLFVTREPTDVRDELKRAQRAWRAVYNAKAYRLKTR